MIHLTKGQTLSDNKSMVVYDPTGYYNDGDTVVCASVETPDEPVCRYEAKFIAYGGMVYSVSDTEALNEEIAKIDPENLFGKDSKDIAEEKKVEEIETVDTEKEEKKEEVEEKEEETAEEEEEVAPEEEAEVLPEEEETIIPEEEVAPETIEEEIEPETTIEPVPIVEPLPGELPETPVEPLTPTLDPSARLFNRKAKRKIV